MSDLDGERAFDLITDRMLDLNSRLDAACRDRDEARRDRNDLERQVKSLEARMQSAAADAMRFKALVPADALAATEARRTPMAAPTEDPEMPF